VPAKWKLNNKPSQVLMVSEGEDAVILLLVTSGSSSKEAAREFITKTGFSVTRSEGIQVNGLPSQRVISEARTQKAAHRLISYFIEKEKNVFMFHGWTDIERFQNYGSLFENTMSQFKELSDPKRIHVKPDRVRIRSAKATDTLENVLRSFGVRNEKLKVMALLNGRDLNEMILPNTLIKVVEK
jgi:predicted Zn-dependent protease